MTHFARCLAEVHRLLAERAGLDIESLGRSNIAHAVEKRLGSPQLQSPQQFLGRLQSDATVFRALLEEILVLETWFFRDPLAFDCLQADAAQWRAADGNIFRALSVACSTGEEPFSMAMTIREAGLAPTQSHVLGTDLSDRALDAAREAVYAARSFRQQGPSSHDPRERWCEGMNASWRVRAEIRSAVKFRWGNLACADFLAGEPPFQAVFCRNVLIYFHPQARSVALANLHRLASPNGLVCCAPAEARILSEAGFASLGSQCPFAFRRSENRAANAKPPGLAAESLSGPPPPATHSARSPEAWTRVPLANPPSLQVHDNPAPAISIARLPGPEPVTEDPSEPTLLEQARQAADRGRLVEADALCKQVLTVHPTCPEAHYLQGVIRQSQGAGTDARQWFEKTLYLNPQHYEALVHLMLLAEQSGDSLQASNYRRRAQHIASAEVDR